MEKSLSLLPSQTKKKSKKKATRKKIKSKYCSNKKNQKKIGKIFCFFLFFFFFLNVFFFVFFVICVMFWDFGQPQTFVSRKKFLYPEKSLCIPKKSLCIPKKVCVSRKKWHLKTKGGEQVETTEEQHTERLGRELCESRSRATHERSGREWSSLGPNQGTLRRWQCGQCLTQMQFFHGVRRELLPTLAWLERIASVLRNRKANSIDQLEPAGQHATCISQRSNALTRDVHAWPSRHHN